MAVYAYIRVSTDKGQTTDNQRKQIVDAGFAITEFFSEDGVSGSVKAQERPAFSRMLAKMQKGDKLVITMIDRLGRCASDILNVVEMFAEMGVSVCVLQFQGIDITSSMGKMVMTCMGAMAELERNILIERTKAGMARTKEQGTKLGRALTISPEVLRALVEAKASGMSLDKLTAKYGIPRNTIYRNIQQWAGKMGEYEAAWNACQQQALKKAA
jgi:putative DNA-invertase from lambdoid prophage Rac